MKKEEAIEMLKSKMDGSIDTSYEWAETVRMAIEALQAQPTHGRLIDADALIEDFNKLNEWLDLDEEVEIVSLINNAPTVQVEVISEDMQTKMELTHIKARLENVEKRLQGLILYGGVIR